MMKSKDTSKSHEERSPIVVLQKLPSWVSEERVVRTTPEFIISLCTSGETLMTHKLAGSPFKANLSCAAKECASVSRRLTRSVGEKLSVDFSAKLPDDRHYKHKFVEPCNYPFHGFDSCHHAIYLSNSEPYQFLTNIADNVDFIYDMIFAEFGVLEEETEKLGSSRSEDNSVNQSITKKQVKSSGKLKRKQSNSGKSKKHSPAKSSAGQVTGQSNNNEHNAAASHMPEASATCGNDFCRLGCMCKCLNAKKKRTHCGHEECMFSNSCCKDLTAMPVGSNRLTLLGQTSGPDADVVPAKRLRRPPKRWLEEEEELDALAEMKRKMKLLNLTTHPLSHGNKMTKEDGNVLINKCIYPGGSLHCLEHNIMNCPCLHNNGTSHNKKLGSVAVKSTGGLPKCFTFKQSVVGHEVCGPSSVTHSSPGMNLEGSPFTTFHAVAGFPSQNQGILTQNEWEQAPEQSSQTTLERQYFRSFKLFRRICLAAQKSNSDLEPMCSISLSPLPFNSVKIMKWCDFEKKVREESAHLWISQVPKCVAKMLVTESNIPPDLNSIDLKSVGNFLNIPSSVDYLFQLVNNQPEHHGCCILLSYGSYWEVKGNLDLKTKVNDRFIFKTQRTSKGPGELTFANSGKKILICQSSYGKPVEDYLRGSCLNGEMIESEIKEIPETDIHINDSGQVLSPEKVGFNATKDHCHNSIPLTNLELDLSKETVQQKPSYSILVPSCGTHFQLYWYCLNLDKSFDKVIIENPNITVTYGQLLYALRTSKEKNMPVKISCNSGSNYSFNNQTWKQGIYADYSLSDISVKIGPYNWYEAPEIRAFFKVNGIFCRTMVQLIKEPLTMRTVPRVSKKQVRKLEPEKAAEPPSCSILKSFPSEENQNGTNVKQSVESSVTPSVENPNCNISATVTVEKDYSEPLLNTEDIKCEPPDPEDAPKDNKERDLNLKIESVLGNWTGFDEITTPVSENTTGEKANERVNACKDLPMKSSMHTVPGYLVADIPNLKPIAVIKGGTTLQSNMITMKDPSWDLNGTPMTFKNVLAASVYLNSISRAKFYPDNLRIRWAFVRGGNLSNTQKQGLVDIRELTDIHFITAKGVFHLDEVCHEDLPNYGLPLEDNRRLLEFRRRRDIRAAKNELISLLPDPKTDILVKVIQQSRTLIRFLEMNEDGLLDRLKEENIKKGRLLAKLRTMCTGEEMFKVFDMLENIISSSKTSTSQYESASKKNTFVRHKLASTCKSSVHKQGKKNIPERHKPASPFKPPVRMKGKYAAPSTQVVMQSPKPRNMFSGRLVSMATKRSLRKYNYIIPTLARKSFSLLNKVEDHTIDLKDGVSDEICHTDEFSGILIKDEPKSEYPEFSSVPVIDVPMKTGSFEESGQLPEHEMKLDGSSSESLVDVESG